MNEKQQQKIYDRIFRHSLEQFNWRELVILNGMGWNIEKANILGGENRGYKHQMYKFNWNQALYNSILIVASLSS